MATIHSQYNFANGEISRRFWGRSDIPLYSQAVASATNVLISESGSLTKRPGFETVIEGNVATQIIPYSIVGSGFFLAEFSPLQLRIIHPNTGEVRATFVTEYVEASLFDLQHTQIGNRLLVTHKNYHPKRISLMPTGWAFDDDFAPGWDTPGNYPAVVSFYKQRKIYASSINNPRRIGFSQIGNGRIFVESFTPPVGDPMTAPELYTANVFGARLTLTYDEDLDDTVEVPVTAFAVTVDGVEEEPTKVTIDGDRVILSIPTFIVRGRTVEVSYTPVTDMEIKNAAGLLAVALVDEEAEFSDGSIVNPDDPIEIDIAAEGNDEIVAILPFETFFVFTNQGVWGNDNPRELTPQNISFSKRSSIGCSNKVRPIIFKNNILYVPRTRDEIYLFEFDFNKEKFSNISLTRAARHLFEDKKIINWATNDLNDLVLIVFEAGVGDCIGREVVCFKYDPTSGLHGFTVWDTEGVIGDLASEELRDIFYFAIARRDSENLEKIDFHRGDDFTDPNDELFTVGITTLPLEGIDKTMEQKAQSSIVYAKVNNTTSMGVKGIAIDEFTPADCSGQTEICEVDVNSVISRNSQIYFRNKDSNDFELLSYSVVGKVNSRGEQPKRSGL